MKVRENLICWKTDATKVAAAERGKKKTHNVPPMINLEKKTTSKRKVASVSEKDKGIVIEYQ
jgi:hypothetical protein